MSSRTYQASSKTSQWNRGDVAHFSHYYVKRLGAETLLDAIEQVTERWDTYRSIIPEPYVVMPAAFRATHLADGSISLPFLELFGRPPRDTAYESDRDLQLYLRQTLHLLNSSDVQGKISSSPRLARLAKEAAEDPKIIEELYLATLSRLPREEDKSRIAAYLSSLPLSVPENVLAEQKAAGEALAKVRAERGKIGAEYDAAERAAKAAQTAAAKAKDAAARAAANKTAADERKLAADAKTRRDKLPAQEKAANARLTAANKGVDAAKAAIRQRKDQAIQDLMWALLNTKEFVFSH